MGKVRNDNRRCIANIVTALAESQQEFLYLNEDAFAFESGASRINRIREGFHKTIRTLSPSIGVPAELIVHKTIWTVLRSIGVPAEKRLNTNLTNQNPSICNKNKKTLKFRNLGDFGTKRFFKNLENIFKLEIRIG